MRVRSALPLAALLLAGLRSAPTLAEDGSVALPLAQWESMLDQLHERDQPAPAPISVQHVDRSVTGSFQRGVFSGRLTVTLVVPPGQEHGRVPVIGADCSVGLVQLDGKPTSALLEGSVYTVSVPGPGQHTVSVDFFQGREDDRFRRQLSVGLPEGGPTRVSLWLPETDIDVSLARGALVLVRPEQGRSLVNALLDGHGSLDLSWKRRLTDQPSRATRVEAEVDTVFSLEEALVQGVSAIEWQVSEGEADRFELAIPRDVEVLDVTGEAVLQWFSALAPAGSEEGGRLTVLLRHPVADQTAMRVQFQFPMNLDASLKLAMPLPVLPEGVALRGHLGVQGPAGLGVTVEQAEGVEALDARDLPPGLLELAGRPLLQGFDLRGEPSVSLAVTRQADLELTDTLIDDVQASTVALEDGTEVGKLRLRLRNSTRQYLSVVLPEGAILTHARIDGRPVRPAVSTDGGQEALLFPLQQSERLNPGDARVHVVADGETLSGIAALYDTRPGFWLEILDANRDQLSTVLDLAPGQALKIPTKDDTQESSFIIELAYKRARAPIGWLGHRALELPRLDVDVVSTNWHIYLPEAVLPFGFDANLSQTSNLRYDPIRRLFFYLERALSVRSAWAGGDGYESILSKRRSLYRSEVQSKASAGEVLSSFPFTGRLYSFQRLLPGQETAAVGFYWIDRDGIPLLRWGALIAAFALTTSWLRGGGRRGLLWGAVLALLLIAHVIPGVHRRLLWGFDLALAWDLYLRAGRPWLRQLLEAPPSLRGLWRAAGWRDVIVVAVPGFALWTLAAVPLLASTLVGALLLGARRVGSPASGSPASGAAPDPGVPGLGLLGLGVLALGALGAPEARAEDWDAADMAAEAQFDSIMSSSLGYVEGGDYGGNQAPARPAAIQPAPATVPESAPAGAVAPTPASPNVEVPLARYESVRAALTSQSPHTPVVAPVVLGSSRYTGEAGPEGLVLQLELGVTLSGPDRWKIVPIIGEDVVIGRTRIVGGGPIPLSTREGYHVWVTRETGEVQLVVDVIVPARGPKGSLEYDFLAPRTPITHVEVSFPGLGMEPRLRNTVRASLSAESGKTKLVADLSSSSRVHLVGYRDLGENEGQTAQIYAENMNLLSLGEDALELFTVLRYSILYAGAREFQIVLPEGWTLVSAEAEGAFRHTLEPTEGGTLLRGETAFPIRNSFEISLRLRRALPESGAPFGVQLPRGLGLERQYGWLAAEVNGNLKLAAGEAGGALRVDARQLPYAMVESAVSPILMAWRVLDPATAVQLTATAMPEKEPASGSIDKVEALSAVSIEGTALTELRVTLRNRLRHSLAMRLPEGARVRTAFLDDQPVVPSQGADGSVLFPLKRSDGGDRPDAFTLTVVLESQGDRFGLFGWNELELPTLDLPVSSLSWSLRLPGRNHYSRLVGDVSAQSANGSGVWYQPATGGFGENPGLIPMDLSGGATPIKVEIPGGGRELSWKQYWIGAQQPVTLSVAYGQSWLRGPLALLLAVGLVLGLGRSWALRDVPRALPVGTPRTQALIWLVVGGLALALMAKLAGQSLATLTVAAGLGLGLLRRPGLARAMSWAASLLRPAEPSDAPRGAVARGALLSRFVLSVALLGALWVLGLGVIGLLWMLPERLGG